MSNDDIYLGLTGERSGHQYGLTEDPGFVAELRRLANAPGTSMAHLEAIDDAADRIEHLEDECARWEAMYVEAAKQCRYAEAHPVRILLARWRRKIGT